MSIQLILQTTSKDFQMLKVEVSGNGIAEPYDNKELSLPAEIDFTKGTIVNGKALVWLYASILYMLNISKWVATINPHIRAMVVQSHYKNSPQTGDIISFDKLKS